MTVQETATEFSADAPPPAYFLSLSVENFRCFGPKQTLYLSNNKGRPAQWTVLLGENGVGKTTILQVLALIQPKRKLTISPTVPMFGASNYLLEEVLSSYSGKRPNDSYDFSATYVVADSLSSQHDLFRKSLSITGQKGFANASGHNDANSSLICYGYGASRQMSNDALTSDSRVDDIVLTLFDQTAHLNNAEEWLVRADYAIKTADDTRIYDARKRLDLVQKLLISILPDVTDFRFGTTDDSKMTPRVEVETPYGWVRVASLSLGYKGALTWMVDFASRLFERYPDSPNPLAEPAI